MAETEPQPLILESQPDIPKKEPIWGFWSTLGLGVGVMVVFLLAQLAALVVFLVAKYLANPQSLSLPVIESLGTNGFVLAVASIASAIVCSAMIVLLVKLKSGAKIKTYLALNSISIKAVLALLGITLGFLVLSSVIGYFVEKPGSNTFTAQAYQTSGPAVIFWLALVVFAPFFEELFFRGFLFKGFSKSKLGTIGTIILTALLWSLLHFQYDIFGVGMIFALGIILGFVRYRTGSLWSTIAMHMFWNLLGLIGTALSLGQ
jgi:uncharacterized protein